MEKQFNLDQRETALLEQLDKERQQALAMVGALSLDMEQARKQLDTAAERQRAFIRQALTTRGIDRYENARAQGNVLMVSLPDEPLVMPEGGIQRPAGLNGPVVDISKSSER